MRTPGRARRIVLFSIIGAGLTLIGIAAASSLLFVQTFPSVPSGSISPNCSDLQAWNQPIPVGGGFVVFNCTSYLGAFIVNAPTTATPSFTLPTNATDLYVFPSYLGTWPSSCSAFSGAIELTSGVSVSLETKGSWDYCIDASGSLQGFSISWST